MTSDTPQRDKKRVTRKKRSVRRKELVEAAVSVIAKHGVRGATVSRIAAAAGVSRGALYHYFENREDLLEAALQAIADRSSLWWHRQVDSNIADHLLEMGKTHADWAISEFDTFVRPFFQLIASERPGRLTAWMVRRMREELAYLIALAEEGKRQGSIRHDVPSEDIAWTMLLHAWGEDIARLLGVEDFIDRGISTRILTRALSGYAAHAVAQTSNPGSPSTAGNSSLSPSE
ncbi:MAG: TetR/AcrR family transcriptional regulator [Thermoleophilia bacterium]|nr:TetR/AcrR family transcriptional regulator [Thermoleophilia bacterium]